MEDKKKKIYGIVYILLTMTEKTNEALEEEEFFANLPNDKMTEVIMEFLIFNLHQIDRTLYAWLGQEERNKLMNGVLVELHSYLSERGKAELAERYANLTTDTLGDYLEELRSSRMLEDFFKIYNARQAEYAAYHAEPKKDEGLRGTLVWEFGKKISRLVGRGEHDLAILMKVTVLGTGWTYFADAMKKVLGLAGDLED